MDKPTGTAVGTADFVFGFPARDGRLLFCAIEIKVGKNKATAAQEAYLNSVKSAGGIAAVCRSIEEIRAVLSAI